MRKSRVPTSNLAVFVVFILLINPVSAQVKIYVNIDLEGISGVFKFNQTREKDSPLNIQACEYFMGDVAAVVQGLRDGTGDEATCREAKKFFGNNIVTVAVKPRVARESAVLYPFEETRKALYEGAKQAVAAISSCKPDVLEAPIKVKEEYLNLDPSLQSRYWLQGKALLWTLYIFLHGQENRCCQ